MAARIASSKNLLDAAIIYRQQPRFAAPDGLAQVVRETLAAR